jgi:hypothetical protein
MASRSRFGSRLLTAGLPWPGSCGQSPLAPRPRPIPSIRCPALPWTPPIPMPAAPSSRRSPRPRSRPLRSCWNGSAEPEAGAPGGPSARRHRAHDGQLVDRGGAHRARALYRPPDHPVPSRQGANGDGPGQRRLHRGPRPGHRRRPVWLGPDGPEAWTNNPWRAGWLALNAHDTLVPLIIPLGDLTDSHTLAAEQALDGDRAGLEAMRAALSADAIIVAVAAPLGETAIRATMVGETATGAGRFRRNLQHRGRRSCRRGRAGCRNSIRPCLAEWRTGAAAYVSAAAVQSISVAVPLSSLEQWNGCAPI